VSRWHLRIALLALSAGCVDAVGFLLLFGIFTAHLSGDTTHLAVDLGSGNFGHDALARLVVLAVFVAGVFVGVAIMTANAERRRGLLVIEIVCLVAVAVTGAATIGTDAFSLGSAAFYALVALAAVSMGLQTAYLRREAGAAVHTTFITGMLTALAEDTVAWYRDRSDTAARRRVAIHGGIWIGYVAGGVAGAALALEWDFWALMLPVVLLVVLLIDEFAAHSRASEA
jgi:uncharacterized membrane protein YoaK (UPF0700 family)